MKHWLCGHYWNILIALNHLRLVHFSQDSGVAPTSFLTSYGSHTWGTSIQWGPADSLYLMTSKGIFSLQHARLAEEKKTKTQHKANQHHLQLLRILRLDNYLEQSRICYNRNKRLGKWGVLRRRWLEIQLVEKKTETGTLLSTSFFSQFFP